MNTDTLMSSLREMVCAEVHVQLIALGVIHASPEQRSAAGLQYSRHETVVRQELARLGAEASSYKEAPRFGPARLGPQVEVLMPAIAHPLPWVDGDTVKVNPAPHAAAPINPSPVTTVKLGG